MEKLLITGWLMLIVMLNCPAEEMDASSIKQFVNQMDDTLPQGNIYHIDYSVTDKRTDAFYAHRLELIKLLQGAREKEAKNRLSNTSSTEPNEREQNLLNMEKSFQHDLKRAREYTYISDYTVDGIGFYLKQQSSFVSVEGVKSSLTPTIYASDGKIMGTFYLDDSQAVIQPATERPQVPTDSWTDVAYLIIKNKVSHFVEIMNVLKITSNEKEMIITGEKAGEKKEMTHLQLSIDKASLKPLEMTMNYYGTLGGLINKTVKKWQYQDFSGISLPKVVVDQTYETDISGKLNLEREQTFTINDFSPGAKSTKESFKGLLKSNYSIYDEITGQHYMSGNPEEMLDKLSR